MISDDETLRFITATFPSVWSIELVLLLKRQSASLSREDLIEKLRASEVVVSKALEALLAAGLVSVENERVIYLPVTRGVEIIVEGAEDLYRRRPNAVCRAIVAARTGGATAFADAFRLRRDKGE